MGNTLATISVQGVYVCKRSRALDWARATQRLVSQQTESLRIHAEKVLPLTMQAPTAPTTSWGRLCEQIVDHNGVVVSKWTVCAPVLGHQCLVGLILKYKVLLFDPTNNCRFAGDILRCTEFSGRKKKDKGRDSDMTGHCRLSHY